MDLTKEEVAKIIEIRRAIGGFSVKHYRGLPDKQEAFNRLYEVYKDLGRAIGADQPQPPAAGLGDHDKAVIRAYLNRDGLVRHTFQSVKDGEGNIRLFYTPNGEEPVKELHRISTTRFDDGRLFIVVPSGVVVDDRLAAAQNAILKAVGARERVARTVEGTWKLGDSDWGRERDVWFNAPKVVG